MAESKKELPFSGKWMTADQATIGPNFSVLTNMRYTDTHIKNVKGMTKINSNVMDATYLKTRNAFHFRKAQPSESHVIVQAYNDGETASHLLNNKTAIPSAGQFEATDLHTDAAGAGLGRFCEATDGQMFYCNGEETCMWGGDESQIGALVQTYTALSAATDKPVYPFDRTDDTKNTNESDAFTCGGDYKSFLVGSPRPIQGATIYIASANTTDNTLVVKESTAGAWNTLTVVSDGTRASGKSFAQTGKITWSSTVATTKPKYIDGYFLYWYQFTIDAGSASIYHITLDIPFQDVIDMWDGVYREAVRCYYVDTSAGTREDKTTNVLYEDYDTATASTYMDISSMSNTAQSIEVGFAEKVSAIFIGMGGTYINVNAAVMTVKAWVGTGFQSVGDISDGTSDGTNSLATSGVVSWSHALVDSEAKKSYYNQTPLYYYQITFDAALDASMRIDYIGGISASKSINAFKFPVFAQGRVLLCCEMQNEKNKAIVSAKYMPQSFNGTDSVDLYYGDDGELTCGVELFSQYGSSLYSLILMFKDTETWVTAGQDIEQWASNTFLLSNSIGCPAPLTLKTINLRAEPGAGINRALAIWQAANGVYMSDGRAPIPIHGDIEEYFDSDSSLKIKDSMVGDSVGFVDDAKQEYHLLVASGSDATSLNTELVYDIKRNKWFKIDRTADLQCGVTVKDTDGNAYCYGFLDTGYMERLEYGTTFDGTDITSEVQFGDIPLGGWDVETGVSDVTLFTVAQTNDITCTHYGDTSASGTSKTMDHTSTNRLAMPSFQEKLNGYFHSLKYSTTGSFEPLATVVWFHSL